MASSNYFNYGGTQYANAANATAYQQTQQGYSVPPNATGNVSNAAATTPYPSQRNAFEVAAAAAAYQTSAAPVTYAPAAVGVTYDSSKTYYQQASPAAVAAAAAAAASSGQGSVTVASSADFQNWQQANYGARQSPVASSNKITYNAPNYSAVSSTTRQLTASSITAKSQSGTNASPLYSSQYTNNQQNSAQQNAGYHYSNPPTTANAVGAKAVTVGTIGQQLAKKTTGTGYQSNSQPLTGNGSLYNNASATPGRIKTNQQSGVSSTTSSSNAYSNPYDAALFNAAATMYMNQNPRTSAKTGGSSFGSGVGATATANNFKPRQGFRNNAKFRSMRPPKPQQLHYCDACKISCAGPSAYHDHLQGQKHKKKVAKTNLEQTKGKTTVGGNLPVFICELCDIECTAADAYAAHLRGAKHTKVVKLHTRLGKPIPPPDPKAAAAIVSLNTQEDAKCKGGTASSTARSSNTNTSTILSSNSRSLLTPRISFVAAGTLTNVPQNSSNSAVTSASTTVSVSEIVIGPPKKSTVVESSTEELSGNEDVNKENDLTLIDDRPAVGSEYIEEEKDSSGKLISFNCKLCECKFSDPNAKEMHMKGRKHRLQFKRKVDPKLKVEMKPNNFKNKKNDKWKKSEDKVCKDTVKRKEFRFEDEGNHLEWNRKLGVCGPSFGVAGSMPPQAIRHPLMRATPRPLLMGNTTRLGPAAGQPLQPPLFMMGAPPLQSLTRKLDTYEDRHVQCRFKAIYPSDSELKNIDKMLGHIEKALKFVSDHLLNDAEMEAKVKKEPDVRPADSTIVNSNDVVDEKNTNCSTNENSKNIKDEVRGSSLRELTGVLRIGIIAKDLVSIGDNEMELVMLCSRKPTVTLLNKVVSLLPDKLKEVSKETEYTVEAKPADAAIVIVSIAKENEKTLTVKVTLTSTIIREEIMAVAISENNKRSSTTKEDTNSNTNTAEAAVTVANGTAIDDGDKVSKDISPDPPDVLSKTKCLEALAALRHAKWFQARAATVPSCSIVIRILRDICERVNAWAPLNSWTMELLCEKVLSSCNMALSPGDGLRRVFESIAAGVLLPDGPGLLDPCEKDPVDAASYLTSQQREDITAFAQYVLRLIAFRQIHKVLGIDPLPAMVPKFRNKQTNRKRRRENSAGGRNEGVDGKKDKKEEEGGENVEEDEHEEDYDNDNDHVNNKAGGGQPANEEPPLQRNEERMETDKPPGVVK